MLTQYHLSYGLFANDSKHDYTMYIVDTETILTPN